MKLTDLFPEWANVGVKGHSRFTDSNSLVEHGKNHVEGCGEETLIDAQGILFLCPTCFKKNGGEIGTHSVLIWFAGRGVPDDRLPGPGRWETAGDSFENLTLAPSVNVDHEHWHGWIKNGEVS